MSTSAELRKVAQTLTSTSELHDYVVKQLKTDPMGLPTKLGFDNWWDINDDWSSVGVHKGDLYVVVSGAVDFYGPSDLDDFARSIVHDLKNIHGITEVPES